MSLEQRAFFAANDSGTPLYVRDLVKDLWLKYCEAVEQLRAIAVASDRHSGAFLDAIEAARKIVVEHDEVECAE